MIYTKYTKKFAYSQAQNKSICIFFADLYADIIDECADSNYKISWEYIIFIEI